MAYFSYRGRNAAGELVQGVLEGADSGAVATQLFGSGITPVDIGTARKPNNDTVSSFLARLTSSAARKC